MTGMTGSLAPPTVPIGSLMDQEMGLQEPVVGTNTMDNSVTHHINPHDGGSLQNNGLQLHAYVADQPRRLHCKTTTYYCVSAADYSPDR